MKISSGKTFIFLGVIHTLLSISPFAFGEQFGSFTQNYFFKISEGLSEFPILNGQMNYENFAAFWFFYYGLLFFPLGILVTHIEKTSGTIPRCFSLLYLFIVLLGAYMIPFSGMTFFMLPHALYLVLKR